MQNIPKFDRMNAINTWTSIPARKSLNYQQPNQKRSNMKLQIIKTISVIIIISSSIINAQANDSISGKKSALEHKYFLSTTWLTFDNFQQEDQNIHMYEFHLGYRMNENHNIGIKVAGWNLFEPMGIPLWDPHLMKKSEYYPGRLKERGIGFTYQYFMKWKLFSQIEVLPLWKTYIDRNGNEISDGFKLYTTFHIGYSLRFLNDRIFIEPQMHCNFWPIDTKAPDGFDDIDNRWNNYFLFEPNIFFGANF